METTIPKTDRSHNPAYKRMGLYTIALIGTLLIVHVLALVTLYLYERNAAHDELVRAATHLDDFTGSSDDSGIFPGLPSNTIVLQRPDGDRDEEYYEKRIGEREYHVYAPRDSQYVLAQSEYNVHRELIIFGAILALLYFAEVLLIGGWWISLRGEIKETFTVH